MENKQYDSIIIGAGPAGLTAGIYLSRAKARVLILDSGMAGGQIILTHEVANYPGFESISGYMLAMNMKKQAEKHGCEIKTNAQIIEYDLQAPLKQIKLSNGESYTAKTVILATGGRSRKIGAIKEDDFAGRGISYCATCDGDFFQDREIIVIGGGNSALEEAVSLTKYASKVTIVHMLDQWQAFASAVDEMKENPKIDYLMNSKIVEFVGQDNLAHVIIEEVATGKRYAKKIDGVFIFIGYVPNTEEIKGLVELNQYGEIIVDAHFKTNLEGVYAAGDSIVKRYRQITTAVSDGTQAALNVLEYIKQ
jgi:thioredoxin reductase (NADPH)